MATLIDISRHPGILRGEGIEFNCTVEMENIIAMGLPPVHVGHHIIWIEKELPEGDYQLFVHDVFIASLHFKVSARPPVFGHVPEV